MVICTSAGVYGDEIISATELNRHPGRVLDMALERPVTITRNDNSFALLRRDDMTRLVKAVNQINIVFEVLNVAYRLRLGEQIGTEHPYGWLNVFDTDELHELIEEVISAFRRTESDPGAWDALNAVIHEWHESAIAIQSHELKNAFSDKDDEVLLTQPTPENTTELAEG
jgi:hypothetical protein